MGIEQIRKMKEDAGIPKQKPTYYLPKVSKKKAAQLALQQDNKGDNGLDKWFEERRKEMTGRCVLCNGTTEKHNDDTYRRSIHHLFDKKKALFPSVALHSDNWLELCFYGNSCHQNIHNRTITWELLRDSKEWEIIVAKFKKIFPYITQEERKNIPEILLNELK